MAMKITLANLRRDLSKLDPATIEYLRTALPFGEISRNVQAARERHTAQLYLAEALHRMEPTDDEDGTPYALGYTDGWKAAKGAA